MRDNYVGGVIWFQSTTDVVASANRELQQLSKEPLLISGDLESGMGMRFTDTVWWPPAMALAAMRGVESSGRRDSSLTGSQSHSLTEVL